MKFALDDYILLTFLPGLIALIVQTALGKAQRGSPESGLIRTIGRLMRGKADHPKSALKSYDWAAWPLILMVSGALSFLFKLIVEHNPEGRQIYLDMLSDPDKQVFMIYLSFYISIWVVYFSSSIDHFPFNIRTLRRRLTMFSQQWNSATPDSTNDIEKAKSSTTSTSMLIAASAVVLGAANSIYSNSDKLKFVPWQYAILAIAAICAMSAFFSLIIAVDSLETMFNKFLAEDDAKMKRHYYLASRNPRYYGKALLLASVSFATASISPLLGAFGIAVVLVAGYSHWFPASLSTSNPPPKMRAALAMVVKIGFLLAPLAVPLSR
jgi:protein-S-isoprenylcysteine O-methyltransferase Ste14